MKAREYTKIEIKYLERVINVISQGLVLPIFVGCFRHIVKHGVDWIGLDL